MNYKTKVKMTNKEKIEAYRKLINSRHVDDFINTMDLTGDTVFNYYDYLIYTDENGMNPDKELKRLEDADYKLCCVLLTMLIREDRFSNSFQSRIDNGDVITVVERMINLLTKNSKK